MLRYFALTVLLIGATCRGMTPKNEPNQLPDMEFEVVGAIQAGAGDTVTVTGTARGEVTLTGVITTPNPCYEFAAELTDDGELLVLRVDASPLPRICPQVIAAFEYRARLYHLRPGTYAVGVAYRYTGTGWKERRYDVPVTVPN